MSVLCSKFCNLHKRFDRVTYCVYFMFLCLLSAVPYNKVCSDRVSVVRSSDVHFQLRACCKLLQFDCYKVRTVICVVSVVLVEVIFGVFSSR